MKSPYSCRLRRRAVFAIPFLALTATVSFPAPTAAQSGTDPILSITEAELRDHIFYLASDDLVSW